MPDVLEHVNARRKRHSLNALPRDIMVKILQLIEYNDVKSLRLTNRSLRHFLTSSLVRTIDNLVAGETKCILTCRHCKRHDPKGEALVWNFYDLGSERRPLDAQCADCLFERNELSPGLTWWPYNPADKYGQRYPRKPRDELSGTRVIRATSCCWCSGLHLHPDDLRPCFRKYQWACRFNQFAACLRMATAMTAVVLGFMFVSRRASYAVPSALVLALLLVRALTIDRTPTGPPPFSVSRIPVLTVVQLILMALAISPVYESAEARQDDEATAAGATTALVVWVLFIISRLTNLAGCAIIYSSYDLRKANREHSLGWGASMWRRSAVVLVAAANAKSLETDRMGYSKDSPSSGSFCNDIANFSMEWFEYWMPWLYFQTRTVPLRD